MKSKLIGTFAKIWVAWALLLLGLAASVVAGYLVARGLQAELHTAWRPVMPALDAVREAGSSAHQQQAVFSLTAHGSRPAVVEALPVMVMLGGAVISLLMFALVRALAMSGSTAQQMAGGMVGKLRETERRIAESERFSSVMVLHVAIDGQLLKAPPRFCRLLGYSEKELAALRLENLIHADDSAVSWRRIQRLTHGEIKSADCEKRCVCRNGGTIWLSLSCSLVAGDDGEPRYFLVYARDTTEEQHARAALIESESRLAGIVNSAMDAIITVDADQRILVFNTAAESMFCYKAQELLGQPIDRLIPLGHAHRELMRRVAARVAGRAKATSRPITGLRSNGEEFPIEASISQITVNDRPVTTVILRDITERVQSQAQLQRLYNELEERVRQRTAELEAANRELESFSYSVSHDLRAPVRHITGFVDMLQESAAGHFSEQEARYLGRIAAASERMGRLIDDLLAFSRTSRTELRLAQVDMQVAAQRALDELAPELAGRSVHVALGTLPVAHADASLVHLVWVNLLSNAIKYTAPRAEASIEIDAAPGNQDEVIFSVRDNGVGFDPEYAHNLFGVFQRLHTQAEFEGTGVGLATVQRIVHRHGGRVWAHGKVEQGATFYFSLKSAPAPDAARVEHNE